MAIDKGYYIAHCMAMIGNSQKPENADTDIPTLDIDKIWLL